MNNTIVRYGCYYAAALCIGFLLSYFVYGNDPNSYSKSETLGYSIMLLTSIIVVLAVRSAKLNQASPLSFGKALGTGLGVSAIGGLAFAIYNWIYVVWVHPEFLGDYLAFQEAQIRNSGVSEAILEQQLTELAAYSEMMSNPVLMAGLMFITVFLIGALFGLVAALAYYSKD